MDLGLLVQLRNVAAAGASAAIAAGSATCAPVASAPAAVRVLRTVEAARMSSTPSSMLCAACCTGTDAAVGALLSDRQPCMHGHSTHGCDQLAPQRSATIHVQRYAQVTGHKAIRIMECTSEVTCAAEAEAAAPSTALQHDVRQRLACPLDDRLMLSLCQLKAVN